MNINDMSVGDFQRLPSRSSFDMDIGRFSTLVLLPTENLHDSGYRCMDFVAVKDYEPICKLAGGSDVLELDGTSGYGYNWLQKYSKCPDKVPPKSWKIDCLKRSGLLHMWCQNYDLKAGPSLSSFDIYAIEKTDYPYDYHVENKTKKRQFYSINL